MNKVDFNKPVQIAAPWSFNATGWADVSILAKTDDYIICKLKGAEKMLSEYQKEFCFPLSKFNGSSPAYDIRNKPVPIKEQLRENTKTIVNDSQFEAFWDTASKLGFTISR